ncbi:MAG: SGNH/GDSL hydrolase family protein [Dysgonomonas sp.]|uniref:SGNH/GDSL hydrolase family protein n=1 Tax=Dysgonomonas sp. TaxID=1891233 RepID=UPI0039E5522C
MANLNDIFSWFSIGKTPTADQFKQSWSSFWHKSEKVSMSAIFGLENSLNDKASKDDLANATTNFKGYHTSLAALQAEYPQAKNKKDFFAWVGSPYPGTVYKVFADGGAWTDTGEVPSQEQIDLTEYAKKTEVEVKADEETEKGKVVRTPDGELPDLEGVQVVSDGETISEDGQYLMLSNGNIIVSTTVDEIPQSALNITGALLPNGSTNGNAGYYHTPKTDIPAGKTKMLVTPMSTNFGGRALAFYNSAGTSVYILPNADTDTPILVDIPSDAAQYILCRNTGDTYFAGFVSEGTKTYTNTDKIVQIDVINGAAQITELRDLTDYEKLRVVSNGETVKTDGQYLFFEDGTAEFINNIPGEAFQIEIPRSELSIDGYIQDDGAFVSNTSYKRTDKRPIPTGATDFKVYSWGDGSRARVLAFYDSAGVFISAPSNKGIDVIDTVNIPANAVQYALCQNNGATYGCTIRAYHIIDIPVSQISVNGSYINSDGQFLSSGYGYSRSPLLDIPNGASEFEVYSMADGSAARALAFYTADEKFISAPDNKGYGVLVNAVRPASAVKYAISKNGTNPYQCKITVAGTKAEITNENSILLVTKNGDVASSKVLRDFSKSSIKIANRPKAFLKDFLLDNAAITNNTINIVGTGVATANQLRYKAYMSTENIYFSVVFKANAASSVRIGRNDAGSITIDGTTLTIYKSGTSVYTTKTLPFSIVTGNTYTLSCDKLDAVTLRYTISSDKGDTFSITLDKMMADIGYAALGWGVPFFGVINGSVTVKNAILSFVYDFNTVLSIYGDSFIEGNSLLTFGGPYNKWSSLLGDKIGSPFVHISGKGGEVANSGFVSRFKVENSLFKSSFVIVAFGTNHSSLDSYTPSMQQLIGECRANGQVPILQTIPPRSGIDYISVTKAINDWVKASGELYIDFHAALTKPDDETVWRNGYVMSDGTHPTVAGHLAMFEQAKRDLCFLIA